MSKVIVFAGTIEGRHLAEFLSRQKVPSIVCVATQYGGQLLGEDEFRRVYTKRLDQEQMRRLFLQEMEPLMGKQNAKKEELTVVDATHPYAAVVSENIRSACEETGAVYLRLLRKSKMNVATEEDEDVYVVESVGQAVEFLQDTTGNILVTTGSKELEKFTALSDYRKRVYARVLSTPEVAAACGNLGFEGQHLICMQGPFSEELNKAMLRQFQAKWMVTKESGSAGGFEEKIRAAKAVGAKVVLVGRPTKEEGLSPIEVRAYLAKHLGFEVKREISIVGAGMGRAESLTMEALRVCKEAQLLVGAPRVLEELRFLKKDELASYRPKEIYEYMQSHPGYERIALVQSGDVGFYSGAKKLLEVFDGEDVKLYPGISSVVYFCSRLRIPWEDLRLVSLHGQNENIIHEIRTHKKVFALMSKGESVVELLKKMTYYHMGDLSVSVGEDLSYPQERIRTDGAANLSEETFRDLCVILVENPHADTSVTYGLEDESFLRGQSPMTKSEVRSISLSQMKLLSNSVVYDVGAGTGSVSVEAARIAGHGQVYAIEKKPEAVELIQKNKQKFAVDNLQIVEGLAPQALADLPDPTHVFIGGSSGNLKEIMEVALKKNPQVRMVINCIALETVAEALACLKTLPVTDVDIVAVSVAKAKAVSRYHMMTGQNPVYVISCTGGKDR